MTVQATERPTRAPTRHIERRRGLPRGRALAGGFLIALAAVGVFAAYRRAEASPTTTYAVVARDVAPGERLSEDDLALATIELPPSQAAVAHTTPEPLIGGITTHALGVGQIIHRTDVRTSTGYTAPEEVSFSVMASRALGGSLQAGERVDVIGTYGRGADAYTLTVVRDALVISHGQAAGLAGTDTLDVRLGVEGPDSALALAHAVTTAELFLVRSPEGEAPSTEVYRPSGDVAPAAVVAPSDVD